VALNFRIVALAVAVVGVALGVSFGAGVAYGRGDPKTVESGLTQQQIQSLLGLSGAGGQGAQSGQGTQGQGMQNLGSAQQRQGMQSGTQQTSSTTTIGRVTAVDGSTITIQTAQGNQKVNVGASTSLSRITTGSAPDLTAGLTIFATGARKEDGSFDAASITQVPPELQSLLGGASSQQQRTP
jgi:hypothetical protein